MIVFWFEFLSFITSTVGILVSASAAILFIMTNRVEGVTRTFWRGIGFAALALSFFFFLVERKFPSFELISFITFLVGFIGIYLGVKSEAELSHLIKAEQDLDVKKVQKRSKVTFKQIMRYVTLFLALIVVVTLLIIGYPLIMEDFSFGKYIPSLLTGLTTIAIFATIILQIRRLLTESDDIKTRIQNFYPLLAFIMLLIRSILMVIHELPETDIVFIEDLRAEESLIWRGSIIFTLLGFIFLGKWAWTYIKPRFQLRTYVVFLTIISLVATLGSFVFTLLIFSIVEQDNLQLMSEGAHAQYLVMEDRTNTALVFARAVARNSDILDVVVSNDFDLIQKETEDQFFIAGIDILRIYNSDSQVIVSHGDPREVGDDFGDDEVITNVIEHKQAISTFDKEAHVLSPILIARGVYPMLSDDKVVGAVEVGYKIDTAFVDFSKERTGLDVTIYTDTNRSATTIFRPGTADRWVGTDETNEDVLQNVLVEGQSETIVNEELGIVYYSAYVPVRDFQGGIIGMVSVGTPTYTLFENSRQQLLTAFLVMNVIAVFAALVGYLASPSTLAVLMSRMTSSSSSTGKAVQKFLSGEEVAKEVKRIKQDLNKEKVDIEKKELEKKEELKNKSKSKKK